MFPKLKKLVAEGEWILKGHKLLLQVIIINVIIIILEVVSVVYKG